MPSEVEGIKEEKTQDCREMVEVYLEFWTAVLVIIVNNVFVHG